MSAGVEAARALDERARALRMAGASAHPPPTSGDIEALVHATIYVGDQLKRLVDLFEANPIAVDAAS